MEEAELSSFDDPQLKVALQRALETEKAPALLRDRVEALFAAAKAPVVEGMPVRALSFWRRPLVGVAAAAAILLCIGAGIWILKSDPNAPHVASTPALPAEFAEGLVATHDHCCSFPDHHVLKGVPDDDFRLMTQKLREQLGFPAMAAAAGDGWKFYGASGLCMVGPAHSAHLVFKKDDQSLSLFSVAVSSESWPEGKRPVDGDRFENMQSGHPILSWVHEDTVYSVVGASKNGSMDLHEITPIADELRVALGSDDVTRPSHTTVALR